MSLEGQSSHPQKAPVGFIADERWWSGFEGAAQVEAERHLPDEQRGGCTCGFCVWSVEHVVVMCIRHVQDHQHLLLADAGRG